MTAALRPNRPVYSRECVECGASFDTNHPTQPTCGKSCAARRSHREAPRDHRPDQSKANSPEARRKKAAALRGPQNPMFGRNGSLNPAFRTGEYAGVRAYRRAKKAACEDCGATSQPNGRNLSVHHLDRDRTNNDPSNLATLCQACHLARHWKAGDIR